MPDGGHPGRDDGNGVPFGLQVMGPRRADERLWPSPRRSPRSLADTSRRRASDRTPRPRPAACPNPSTPPACAIASFGWPIRAAVTGSGQPPAPCLASPAGKKAYHPRMMVALIMYCYAKGIRSSRAVEMATFDDVGARVICGGLHPDHATNARFVTRHTGPLKGLLVASLVACAREGLVRVDVTAGDGTKVKANASMAASATAEQPGLDIAALEELLEAEVAAWIEQAAAADAAEDALFGGGDDAVPPAGGTPAGAARKRTAGKLARRKAAQAKLQAEARARQEQAEAERAARIAKLAAEKDRLEGRAAEELARGQAKVARYARRAAAAAAGHGPPGQGECHRPGQPGHAAEERRLRPAAQPAGPRRAAAGHLRCRHPSHHHRHHRAAPAAGRRRGEPGRRRHRGQDRQGPVRRRVRIRGQRHRRLPGRAVRRRHPRIGPGCSPGSAAPCTTAATWSPPRSTCGPPSTTCSRPSAPVPAANSVNSRGSPPWQPPGRAPGRAGRQAGPGASRIPKNRH